MPTVTRWFVKLSLIYLVLALVVGLGLVMQRVVGGPDWLALLSPAYFHLFMVGWVTQLIFGVAHWMFPNYSKEAPRGREELIWAALIALNTGLVLRVLAEPLAVREVGGFWGIVLVVSATLQWVGVVLFSINTWPRVRPRR